LPNHHGGLAEEVRLGIQSGLSIERLRKKTEEGGGKKKKKYSHICWRAKIANEPVPSASRKNGGNGGTKEDG